MAGFPHNALKLGSGVVQGPDSSSTASWAQYSGGGLLFVVITYAGDWDYGTSIDYAALELPQPFSTFWCVLGSVASFPAALAFVPLGVSLAPPVAQSNTVAGSTTVLVGW